MTRAAVWWQLYHAARPSRAKSRCARCGCDRVKGRHSLGPVEKGPRRVVLDACPVEILEGDPEIADAIERHRLADATAVPLFAGALGRQDARAVTLAAAVASEIPWVHAAIRRGAEG